MKKVLKIAGWSIATIVFLVLVAVFLLNTAVVQNYVIDKIATTISSKTKSTVSIGKVGIAFPKSFFLRNVYLDDLNKDTLLYAGEIKADLDILALLKGDIAVNKISLDEIKANVSRPTGDSLYNFSFILKAFEKADTVKKVTAEKDSSGFMIRSVSLKNIHLNLNDQYAGIVAKTDFENLELETEKLDIDNLDFIISKIYFSDATVSLTILKSDTLPKNKQKSLLPSIAVNDLQLKNINLKYLNVQDSQFISLLTTKILMEKGKFSGNKNQVSIHNFESTQTSVVFHSEKNAVPADSSKTPSQPFTASVNKINLQQTNLSYESGSATPKNSFDPNHLHIVNLNLNASNTSYSESKSQSEIHDFTFALSEGFTLKKFTADVLLTKNEIKVGHLSLETNNSKVNADVTSQYPSFNAFKESPGKVSIAAIISNTVIDPRDIAWFVPDISKQPFLTTTSPPILLSGNLKGTMDDFLIRNLEIHSGETSINATGRITGITEINKTFFAMSGFQLHTTANDLHKNLPGKMIPANIELPAQLSVTGTYKGTIKSFETDLALNSSFGDADITARSETGEAYDAEIIVDDFNAGKLLRNEGQLGSLSFEAKVKGKGYTKETADAAVDLVVSSAGFNGYEYQNLEVHGNFINQSFEGAIKMNDPNLVFDFSGKAGFKQGEEMYKFSLHLEGINLQKLHFSSDDIRLAAQADLDMKGNTIDNLNGNAGITNIIIIKDQKAYTLDSLLFASVNENGNSEMSLTSSIVSASFKGNIAPGKLAAEITNHVNRYFTINDSAKSITEEKNNFTFEIKIQNHPVISEVLFPKLREFEPGIITGKFDGAANVMELHASIARLNYDGTVVSNALLDLNTDSSTLKGNVTISELSTADQKIEKIELHAEAKENKAAISFSAGEVDTEKRLAFSAAIISPSKGVYESVLGSIVEFGGGKWTVPADNMIRIAKNKPPAFRLSFSQEAEQLTINSKDSAGLEIRFKDFELISISNMFKKDTALVEGRLNGVFTLPGDGAFQSEATLNDLKIRTREVGNIELTAKNSTSKQILMDLKLHGNENDFSLNGTINPNPEASAFDLKLDIRSINMTTVEAFSFGQLTNSDGKISGNLNVTGTFSKPEMNGRINFENVTTSPASLNSQLVLQNESVEISGSTFRLKNFTLRDMNNRTAELNGTVSLEDITNPVLDIEAKTDHFLVMNAQNEKGKNYFGTVLLDSKIKLEGSLSSLKINADIKLNEGSNLGIAIPESQLTSDRGENVVEFNNPELNPIMQKGLKEDNRISEFRNLSVSADIQIDKNATLKIIIDPSTGDSLVVKGDAALSFTLDPGGKMSLTGRYEVDDGSYMVTLQDLIKKQFKIEKGSSITWNGDPLDAEIDMRAMYTVRTSPIDLLANQVSDLQGAERNQYKQRLPFEVTLKLNGQLLKPDIDFEINLPQEHRGAMGGVVSARLAQLNEDESELNKQVFALLVLNRFVQEDPLASESGNAAEGIARQSVSRFLTQQLNQWSAQHISGIELDFDVQSYDDYSTGQSQGRTELGIGLKKQFNDRLSVQVGGNINLEGQGTAQNTYGDLAGDILVEYKLTQDGRYKLKGFRQNQFEEVFEGQILETGAGIVYTRDFDKWDELFRKVRNTNQ